MQIRPLPPEVISLITAGEVIDSLASAVRELAENAIDAQADRVKVELITHSFTVQVTDNGVGMDYDNLQRAALAYTTSKIASKQDLGRICQLGFRGEALHSLAQLGDLVISSCCANQPAWKVAYDRQGVPKTAPQQVAQAQGTVVRVSHLFAHYPQRLSLLPSIAQQIRQVQKQIYDLAIANPHVSWQVDLDYKPWLQIWSADQVQGIITQILPNLSPEDLVSSTTGDVTLVAGLPHRYHRPRPDWIKIIANGRVIKYPELEQTILSSFQGTIPRHRFPLCIVHLRLAPWQIDWNRYSDKSEVYLDQVPEIQAKIHGAISELLHTSQPQNNSQTLFRLAETQVSYQPHSSLRAIAQVMQTYILAEGEDAIYLIEQHIAHERVLYEQLEEQWEIVHLSEPVLLHNLTPEQVERLESIPLDITQFGAHTWAVRSLPKLLVNHPEQLSILLEVSQQPDLTMAMAQLACRTAIKNATPLDLPTMQNLLNQWHKTRNRHTCPHGRPICFRLDSSDLARIFRRRWILNQ
jgi:DNA mismatch repair protein MutL